MHVTIHIENSEGANIKIFDEDVKNDDQARLVENIYKAAYDLDRYIKKFVESMGEDP